MISIHLTGVKEVAERLQAISPRIAKNGLRAASFAAAKVFRDAVKDSAPVRTGLLKDSIIVFRRRSPDFEARHSVGVRRVRLKYSNTKLNRRLRRVGKRYTVEGPAYYGRFVEYGTAHQPARPFARPVFANRGQDAIDAFRARIEKALVDATKL